MRSLSSILRACAKGRFAVCGSFAAALALTPTGAAAQSESASFDARAALIEPLTITKLADLDFGDIIGSSGGTIVLTPDALATCTASAGLVQTNQCQPAVFGGSASFNQRVRIRRPVGNTITLTGPGDDMTVTDITINGSPSLRRVRSNPNWERFRIDTLDGTFIFRVGGTLNVNPNQGPGLYTGTFEIRIDYQ
ncbi:DUF4402 domain-containing protein [uncultured Erythrobacter sp.]|uniref:DUF4402 domain-containing protein n=1 Tax=uncultured Erythrobacter sp. TaxID=263913 RepID=UPI002634AEC0|nr:DUF4402 domain-containing protein [uncultured Erythrobacter sp.]